MTVMLDLAPELVQRLQDKAAQQGKTLEAYLQELATREAEANVSSLPTAPASSKLTTEQWIAEWRKWARSRKPSGAVLEDSRESIYAGRGE